MAEVAVIGAGFGGLAAAVALASAGHQVTVVEAGPRPGGKCDIALADGVEFDTGPSVLTLADVLDELFQEAGTSLASEVELVRASPVFRYLYPDGLELDVYFSAEETLASVRDALGPEAESQLARYLTYARGIWEASAPHFVFADAPSMGSVMRIGPAALGLVRAIDPLRSMKEGIARFVREPHLQMLLERYATYNGSDPRTAPATLNCISHVELALGCHGVRGGMHELVRAFVRVGRRLGVSYRFDCPVQRIECVAGRVHALQLPDASLAIDAVVSNVDVAHLVHDLLPEPSHGLRTPAIPSMSGWTGVIRARRRDDRIAHTVLFPDHYHEEFVDIFDRDRPPVSPTVYLCAQSQAHLREGWRDEEPVFIMANAPPEPAAGPHPDERWNTLRSATMERLRRADLIHETDRIVWERSPTDLARRFPGSRGSLYGAASNTRMAAFQRPPNRVYRIPGLYLATGSAHPGGGVPLCVQSGRTAARALLRDL